MEIVGYLAALIMGLSLGLIGGGGSILTVPILVYLFSQEPLTATTGSLFVVGTTALVGALTNARKKMIDYKTGVLFAIPSFAGVYLARHFLLPNLPEIIFSYDGIILTKGLLVMGLFAIVMVLASRAMISSVKPSKSDGTSPRHASLVKIGWSGFLVGITTGFVGAGGGFLIIPALVVLLKISMQKAVGTSLAIIAVNSLFGFLISINTHSLNWHILLIITAIGVVGIFGGQALSKSVDEKTLKKGFGYFVFVVGLAVLIDQILKLH
ncbi:MAG: sulfite exporter TauE/SafE family protein [Bdellovibrio sp.]|nr:sulfite exporter TauE/SafE family protein [Bdellovibrio sp.]